MLLGNHKMIAENAFASNELIFVTEEFKIY